MVGLMPLQQCLEGAGLQLNERKCATLYIQIDGKAQRWIANPNEILTINGKPVTVMNIASVYKYLGLRTGVTGSRANIGGILQEGLERLKQAPLKPQQRMFILRVFLIPRLTHQLVLGEVSASTLERLD